MKNKDLKRRILDISYKHKLSHLSSCLTAVDIIDEIYSIKKENDKFILGQGHAGLALYVVLEKYYSFDAENILIKHGIHPTFDKEYKIDCSTGSLGQALPIAIGMALAKDCDVYVLESDGSMMEGSNWESIRIASELELENLHIHFNFNGFSAYKRVNINNLINQINAFKQCYLPDYNFHLTNCIEFAGLNGHYEVLTEERYNNVSNLYL